MIDLVLSFFYFIDYYKYKSEQLTSFLVDTFTDLLLNGGVNMSRVDAQYLIEKGVVVFPILSEEETNIFRTAFQRVRGEFPEFVKNTEDIPFVMGGFGAYGNPASFHNGYIRYLRLFTAPIMSEFFGHVAQELDRSNPVQEPPQEGQWYLEHLFDRMCCRPAGSSISAESAHRDLNPQTAIPTGEMMTISKKKKGETVNVQMAKYVPRPWD